METLGSFGTLLFLVALVGSAVMAWAGWQALQSEGGKWQFGMEKATSRTGGSRGCARPSSCARAQHSATRTPSTRLSRPATSEP